MSDTKFGKHKADAKALFDDRGYRGRLLHGQNPALLFEKGVREKIVDSYYWKEQCFALNAATLCDRAADLRFIGGTSGIMGKPTPFLCLAFKLIQLVPDKEVIMEYLNWQDDEEVNDDDGIKGERGDNEDDGEEHGLNGAGSRIEDPHAAGKAGSFKYLKCLAAFYVRLAWTPVEIYKTLEPLLLDFRKIRRRTKDGFVMTYVDQFVDDLLTKDRMCATSLWRLPPRSQLEDLDLLEPRESPIQDEVEENDDDIDEGELELLDRERNSESPEVQMVDSDNVQLLGEKQARNGDRRDIESSEVRMEDDEDGVQVLDERQA